MPVNRPRALRLAIIGGLLAVLGCAVAFWLRHSAWGVAFIAKYPGTAPSPADTPVGIPAWLAWQHFLNAFMIVLILRTGWIIRSKQRPPAFWTRADRGVMRLTGRRQRLGIYHWFHLCLDGFWVVNGLVYIVLLCASGQWKRIVPTDWAVVPNALSAALQYASFDWPTDNAWVNYNALQQLSYFAVVFILSPLAIVTGLRLSPAWPLEGWLAKALPERASRRVHGWSLTLFIAFIVLHVALVLFTGVLRNLNVMYAGNDGDSWLGVTVFALSVGSMVAAWFAATPSLLKRLAGLSGEVR